MDVAPELNLLSFKKRKHITGFEPFEPKYTRFTGKLCRHCKTLFSDKIAFDKHQSMCVSDISRQQNRETEQSTSHGAKATLATIPKLSEVTRFTGKLCQRCNRLFSNKTAFDKHQLVCVSDDNRQQNKETGQSSNHGAETTLHSMPTLSEIVELNKTNETGEIKCEMCPQRFPSVWECRSHLKNAHLEYKKQDHLVSSRHPSVGGPTFTCHVCGKSFSSTKVREEHMRIHTGEKPYQCNYCSKTFRVHALVEIHMRTHTGERPYKCSDCSKAFKTQSAVQRHNREVHMREKPYKCHYCDKAFGQKVGMQQHVQTVHLKQPWKYLSKSRLLRKMQKEQKTQTKTG